MTPTTINADLLTEVLKPLNDATLGDADALLAALHAALRAWAQQQIDEANAQPLDPVDG